MIPQGIYNAFKEWYKARYGIRAFGTTPKNSEAIKTNQYFLFFLRNTGISPESAGVDRTLVYGGTKMQIHPAEGIDELLYQPIYQPNPPPPSATDKADKPEIISQGGYDLMPRRDIDTGEIMGWDIIGPTLMPEDTEITPYQQAQIDMERARMQQEADLLGLTRARETAGGFQQRLAALGQQPGGDFNAKAREFDANKKAILNTLSQDKDRNWLQLQNVQSAENPYVGQGYMTPREQLNKIKDEEDALKEYIKDIEAAKNDPNSMVSRFDVGLAEKAATAQLQLDGLRERRMGINAEIAGIASPAVSGPSPLAAYEKVGRYAGNPESAEFANLSGQERIAFGGAARAGDFYGMAEPAPTGVRVPSWLKSFAPGLANKQFIPGTGTVQGTTPLGITPSVQSLNQLTGQQQRQWAGYVEFAGQRPEDLIASMQKQLPRNISFGRNWAAARI